MAFQDAVAWTWAPATAEHVTREPGPGVRIRLYSDLRQALPRARRGGGVQDARDAVRLAPSLRGGECEAPAWLCGATSEFSCSLLSRSRLSRSS
ncbi:DUF6207 family protein [Streptomyces sp. NPDC055056]